MLTDVWVFAKPLIVPPYCHPKSSTPPQLHIVPMGFSLSTLGIMRKESVISQQWQIMGICSWRDQKNLISKTNIKISYRGLWTASNIFFINNIKINTTYLPRGPLLPLLGSHSAQHALGNHLLISLRPRLPIWPYVWRIADLCCLELPGSSIHSACELPHRDPTLTIRLQGHWVCV